MKIEKVTKNNVAQASYIYAMSWKAGYKNILPQTFLDHISVNFWINKLENSNKNFQENYIASVNGKFVATSSICEARDEEYKGWGEIKSIYVSPTEFRKGFGSHLFRYVYERLENKGYSKVYLWVLKENITARKFYESLGFHFNGDCIHANIGGKNCSIIRYVN